MADDRLDLLDYYELLRVARDAPPDRIREAFHDFALRYHPDRYAGAADEKRERAAQIYRRGTEAYGVLTDLERRKRYDALLEAGELRYRDPSALEERRAKAPAGGVQARTPRAIPFVKKALEAEAAGALGQAKLNLGLALQYEPDNAGLRAHYEALVERMKKG